MIDRDFLNEVKMNIDTIPVPEDEVVRPQKPRRRYPSSLIRLLYICVVLFVVYFMATYGCESFTAIMHGTEHQSMKENSNDFQRWLDDQRR